MKTVIEMAREANIKQAIETPHLLMVNELERFAELVRADAIAEERNRCSQLAIRCSWEVVGAENALRVAALDEAIRAGGETK